MERQPRAFHECFGRIVQQRNRRSELARVLNPRQPGQCKPALVVSLAGCQPVVELHFNVTGSRTILDRIPSCRVRSSGARPTRAPKRLAADSLQFEAKRISLAPTVPVVRV